METTINALIVDPKDSVAVAVTPLMVGDQACFLLNNSKQELPLVTAVPIYHKFSLISIAKGEKIYKYGQVIGRATCDIAPGTHVHSHNLMSIRETLASQEGGQTN
ncbi:MAG: UxaA family hydrolase [Sporomusaceae bacterium]|nr:UxaA family hydrolase [Sporomusaceae bacterium]